MAEILTTHTMTGWYEECTKHPQPPREAPDEVWDAWANEHLVIVGDGDVFRACGECWLGDVCAECSRALQEREGCAEVVVPWPCPGAPGPCTIHGPACTDDPAGCLAVHQAECAAHGLPGLATGGEA